MEGWKTDDLAADTFIDRRTADGSRIGNADIQRQFYQRLGFLSLGLRAMAILFPLSFALWMPGRFDAKRVLLSMPTGVVVMLLANVLSLPGDAVYYGLTASLSVLLIKKRCID